MSFVIRLWLESKEMNTAPAWRWHVRHIQSGDEAYFPNMPAMLQFIADKAGTPPPLEP